MRIWPVRQVYPGLIPQRGKRASGTRLGYIMPRLRRWFPESEGSVLAPRLHLRETLLKRVSWLPVAFSREATKEHGARVVLRHRVSWLPVAFSREAAEKPQRNAETSRSQICADARRCCSLFSDLAAFVRAFPNRAGGRRNRGNFLMSPRQPKAEKPELSPVEMAGGSINWPRGARPLRRSSGPGGRNRSRWR